MLLIANYRTDVLRRAGRLLPANACRQFMFVRLSGGVAGEIGRQNLSRTDFSRRRRILRGSRLR